MSGLCRFDFADGGSYAGGQHDGAAQGLGIYTGPDGLGEYAGSWRGGFEDSGVYRWSGGESCYEGQWLHGRRHGLGVERLEGWLYRGEWTQGFKGRYGLRQSTRTGATYEGSWAFGQQDGYGVETYADGGTYEGQWLRGVRHGYGVRQSVSYDLALRYHQSNALPFSPFPSSNESSFNPHGQDPLLSIRDRRIEQGRAGGFVLVAESSGKDLDKRGKSGLRGALRLVRQRSTGDAESPCKAGVRAKGGSLRSTVSTGRGRGRSTSRGGRGEDEEEEEVWGSFVSLVGDTRFQEDMVEKYWGEWKNDRRSGYGVCERSDGVKYEGEWLNNKKNGYGVTTLRDGTQLAGKYRRNVLLASTSDVKPFLVRTGRLREQVENAIKEAEQAAQLANDKAQIAHSRTTSARVKGDEAQMEAGKAESLAEAARAQAQNNVSHVAQPGSQIFMNCLREEEFLRLSALHPDATFCHAQSKPHTASKFLSLFRPKRRPLANQAVTAVDYEGPSNHNTARFHSATGIKSQQFKGHDLATASTGSGIEGGRGVQLRDRGFGTQRGKLPNEVMVNKGSFAKPEMITVAKEQGLAATSIVHTSALPLTEVANQSHVFHGAQVQPEVMTVTLPTFNYYRNQTGSGIPRYPAPGRRQAHAQIPLPSLSPVASTDDGSPVASQLHFRRNSLPSIVKEFDCAPPPMKPEAKLHRSTTASTSGRKPEAKVGVASGALPEPETIVIEDGVRKRVTPVYGPGSPVRPLAVVGRAGLPKLYRIEMPKGPQGRGSVPNLTEVSLEGVKLPSREFVYALSQQRRDELARERLVADERMSGQIILRLGDVTDWCARRKMLIVLLAVNYALVTVFYNMLQQQEHQQS